MNRPSATIALLVSLIALASCGNPPRPAESGPDVDSDPAGARPREPGSKAMATGWWSQVLLETGSRLSGVAVGDVLPDVPGNEIVVVGTDHTLRLIWRDGTEWRDEIIARTPGEMIQVDVGDVDANRPGDEIVAVGVTSGGEDDAGAKGAVVYVRRDGDEWTATQVYEDNALLHGVCIRPSGVWVTGYSNKIHLLGRQAAAPWPAHSAPLPGPGRSIAPTSGGVVVACRDGSVIDISLSGVLGPVPIPRDKRDAGRARIAAAGRDVLAADDDGTLTFLTTSDDGADDHRADGRVVLHRGPDKLRGAVLADLDPTAPGLEAATAGYDGTIRVFTRIASQWNEDVVARDTDRFHHLTAGELPGWKGVVLVGVNYSGKVTVAGKTE